MLSPLLGSMGVLNPARLAAVVAPAAYRALILSHNPSAYYRLGEASGTVATDETGSYNGTHSATTLGQPGVIAGDSNTSTLFNGNNSTVTLGTPAFFAGASALTYSLWVKPLAFANFRAILTKTANTSTNDISLITGSGSVNLNGSRAVAMTMRNGGNTLAYTASNLLNLNTWTHIGMVFDGTQSDNAGRLKIYLDGTQRTLVFSGTIPSTTPTNAIAATLGSAGSAWNGPIDEVALFSRALSAAEILAHYNKGVGN